jgi:hypothetical protein
MSRLPSILCAFIVACFLAASAIAQSNPTNPVSALAPLLQQNRLLADVARDDPDGLWNLVSKISVLIRNPRDGGAARTAATPTQAEVAQIAANPALRLLYDRDQATTLALLRATNEELQRARLRNVQDQPRRVALVVGSSGDYTWGKLGTTQNDANLIAGALTRQGFELSGGDALIDPDKAHLQQAIKRFAHSIGPGTVALFYYAGHGVQFHARNFLVPTGAAIPQTEADHDRNLVALDDDVLRQMQQAHGRLNILVLDACRDHPPLRDAGAHGTQPPAKGLAPMGAPSGTNGTMIIYATGPNSIARDGGNNEGDSPFASAFAAAVNAGGLEIRDVFDRVEASVDQATHHEQQPWISYSTRDKLYFTVTRQQGELSGNMLHANGSVCPKPGTLISLSDDGQPVTGTYQSPDAAHPALCRLSLSNGKSRTLLYNLYNPEAVADLPSASLALEELLSGRKDHVEFQVRQLYKYPFPHFLESWTRLGQETLDIDNHQVEAIVFEHDTDAVDGVSSVAAFFVNHKRWKVWYDPAVGIIRQTEMPMKSAQSDGQPVVFVSPF